MPAALTPTGDSFRALGSARMPIILALVDTLASALGIICKAADLDFEAKRGFNSAGWSRKEENYYQLPFAKKASL